MMAILGLIAAGLGAAWVVRRRREQHRLQWVSLAWLEEQRRRERGRGVSGLPPWNWQYLIDEMRRNQKEGD